MPAASYTTRELSPQTWPDFEKLFTRKNGWDFCWCMHFQRARARPGENSQIRAVRSVVNRRDKKRLVDAGQAHGILVYAEGEPVGWCQYGLREELPRIDHSPNYRPHEQREGKLWRITCFVVDKKFRRQGVGTAALKVALASIRKKGGGLVEAFPLVPFDELRRSELQQRGHASSFGNVSTHGTVSMFRKLGFKEVGPYGNKNVLMRKFV
ncbi:MAG TPA: GNAT family N-acetyltransferase [Terriglobales bacterium]|nr:GNAT family N-acetyltransferase [Terriglobales bacterium]